MLSALRAVRALSPSVPVVAGNVVTAAGVADLVAAGRGHRQGRGRARRDVHHPDDDRGRAAAVLRGARVRRRGGGAGRARLGRRRCAAPARRRAGAGGGRVVRDDRVLVRRDLRVAWRHVPRSRAGGCTRRASAWRRRARCGCVRRRTPRTSGRARSCSRRGSPRRGCTWTRAARRGGPARHDRRRACAVSCTYAGARDLPSFAERAVVGVQSASGYTEGMPVPDELVDGEGGGLLCYPGCAAARPAGPRRSRPRRPRRRSGRRAASSVCRSAWPKPGISHSSFGSLAAS